MQQCPPSPQSPRMPPAPPPTPCPWSPSLTRPLVLRQDQVGGLVEDDRESFGFSLSPLMLNTPTPVGRWDCSMESSGLLDNVKLEHKPDMNTGRSWSPSPRRRLWPKLKESLETTSMGSCPEVKPLLGTARKLTLPLMGLPLSMEQNPFEEMSRQTGNESGMLPRPEMSNPFPQMFEWSITGPLDQLLRTMTSRLVLNEFVTCSGDLPVLANLAEPGQKEDWTLMLKTLEPSFGADTRYLVVNCRVNNMLSLTNFEAELISLTSCDGLTGIRYVWKSKDPQDHW